MLTDEQRGRFHVWRGRYFDEIDLSLMTPMETAAYKSAFQAGLQARDAEVQALREALEKIVELSSKPLTGGVEFAVAFDSAEKVARAALAGGEEGETE